jgi:hypothetical protein
VDPALIMTNDMSLSVAMDMRHATEEYVVRTPVGVIYLFFFEGGAFRSAVGTGRCFFGSKAAEV